MADEDTRRLIPMSVKKLDDNLYSIEIEGGESYKVECDYDSIKKVFRRIKAKDGCEHGKCRSSKIGTYASMLGDENNTDLHKINVWKSKIPHDPQSFMKLCENKKEDIDMKQIKLTKNYIIEGVVYKKGTIVTLKEKLDFLPTDIWEKAKTIEDKHERFEFVKAELNKLGDDYTDDEIENFLSKYETELTESLTEKEVEGLGDMLDMLEETLESEDYVAKENFKKVLDIAKKDEELLDAWESMTTADDKTFVKKENDFWNRFDKICKPFKK